MVGLLCLNVSLIQLHIHVFPTMAAGKKTYDLKQPKGAQCHLQSKVIFLFAVVRCRNLEHCLSNRCCLSIHIRIRPKESSFPLLQLFSLGGLKVVTSFRVCYQPLFEVVRGFYRLSSTNQLIAGDLHHLINRMFERNSIGSEHMLDTCRISVNNGETLPAIHPSPS